FDRPRRLAIKARAEWRQETRSDVGLLCLKPELIRLPGLAEVVRSFEDDDPPLSRDDGVELIRIRAPKCAGLAQDARQCRRKRNSEELQCRQERDSEQEVEKPSCRALPPRRRPLGQTVRVNFRG